MESTVKLSDELKEKIGKRYSLLTFKSESGDTYHFLFKVPIASAEKFLRLELPWECDEDGLLIEGSWFWEHLEVVDETEEENEGSQEADASVNGAGI